MAHIISKCDSKWRYTRKSLFEILAMPLNGCSKCPEIHPIRTNANSAAAAAGPERKNLIEAIEYGGPLLLFDEPMQLWTIACKLRRSKPLSDVLESLGFY